MPARPSLRQVEVADFDVHFEHALSIAQFFLKGFRMFVPLQQRDGKPLVYVNTDHIRWIAGEGEVGARVAFSDGSHELAIDKSSADKLLGKLEISVYKAR